MKKTRSSLKPEMKAEYDFASMKGGVRGKYLKRPGEPAIAVSHTASTKASRERQRSTPK